MVEIAAFMVVCWLGWKFVWTVWRNRVTVARYAKIAGIVTLVTGVSIVGLVIGDRAVSYLFAFVRNLPHVLNDPSFPGFVPSPGLIVWGVVILAAGISAVGKRFRKTDAKPAQRIATDPEDFKAYLGMK